VTVAKFEPAALRGGISVPAGTYYLLCDHEDAEEGELIVASGHRDGDRILLQPLTDLEEIVSLVVLPGAWSSIGEAAAMDAEGNVFYLEPSAASEEAIPGAGFERGGALQLGRMTTLVSLNEQLFAFGYGGQVYRRTPDSPWQNLNIPKEADEPGYDPCLYAVVAGPSEGTLYFGGTDVGTNAASDEELEAADEAGDDDLYAELLLQGSRPDRTALFAYDGRWRRVPLDYPGAVIELLPEPQRAWLVFGSKGVIWRTRDFLAFDEAVALSSDDYFLDVKAQGGKVLLLLQGGLNLLEDDEVVPFDPPLPPIDKPCLSISPTEGTIAAMFESGVMFFDGNSWTRLYPVFG
jgi:hypothetical protein